jgi:hypothetical protein
MKNDGLPIPETLIACHVSKAFCSGTIQDSFCDILNRTFPEFEKKPGFKMMLRASLKGDQKSKTSVSGMIRTASFQTQEELESLFQIFLYSWEKIYSTSPGMAFSIIIQEQIPASVSGVVFTRLPWDYHSDCIIFDLNINSAKDKANSSIQVMVNSSENLSLADRKIKLKQDLMLHLEAALPIKFKNGLFYESLTDFLNGCMQMHNFYSLPLDIEFAMTDDFKFYFTQFRYIDYM